MPEGLRHEEAGNDGGLSLVALTLVQGANAPELVAAVRNEGQTPACDPGMITSFFDANDALLSSTGSELRGAHYYWLDAQRDALVPCISPGEIAMTHSRLTAGLQLEDIVRLEHRFPAFTIGEAELAEPGVQVEDLRIRQGEPGGVVLGRLHNGLGLSVSNPSLWVFSVNSVGRPLATASAEGMLELAPGDSWSFESGTLDPMGQSLVAYPRFVIP